MQPTQDRPLVSIVTPCLNPGERLARCIASVRAQSYAWIEHIVVDGGSTDGTLERLQSTPGVRWISGLDSGQVEAINKGFELAAGSIVTWLNADDVLVPNAAERAVAAFTRSSKLGLVYGGCRIVEGGKELMTWRAPRRLSFASLESGSTIPQPGAFLRRSALDSVGRLDDSFELAMDTDLWLRLLAEGIASRRLRGVLSEFEVHPASKTGSIARRQFHEENARAFLLAGRPHGAAIALGRAAAAGAAAVGRVRPERLEAELASARATGRASVPPLSERTIAAAASAEAAVIDLRSSVRGLRYLLLAEVWLDRRIRARLGAAARRGAPRVVRRLVRSPWRRRPS